MCTHDELTIILKKMAEIYENVYGKDLIRVVLYGSYARGDYTNDSDIDIAAIVYGEREWLQRKLKYVWEETADLELEFGTILSPTVIPYEEFEAYREDLPYYKNIACEGVDIIA